MIKPANQHFRPTFAQATCEEQIVIMSGKPPDNLPSEVSILKTKAAAKKGLNVTPEKTEVVWPKPEFVCLTSRVNQALERLVIICGSPSSCTLV